MEQTRKYNWGIIGCGKIAHKFTEDLKLVNGANLYGAASRTQDKADEFSKLHGFEKAYGSYKALLADDELDVVYIATPHQAHEDLTLQALKAGKHVLCEKPLAVNEMQVSRMIKECQKQGQFLMEALWSRFNPSIEKIFQLVADGEIGEVNYVNADFNFLRDDPEDSRLLRMDLAGGVLLDMGVYPIFLAYSLMGMPNEIKASAIMHRSGVDVQTMAILEYDNGLANVTSGFISASDMKAKIGGTKGSIMINPVWHETEGFELIQNKETQRFNFPKEGRGYVYEIEECHRCISKGMTQSSKWSHQDSLNLIKITDEIRRQIGLKYPFE